MTALPETPSVPRGERRRLSGKCPTADTLERSCPCEPGPAVLTLGGHLPLTHASFTNGTHPLAESLADRLAGDNTDLTNAAGTRLFPARRGRTGDHACGIGARRVDVSVGLQRNPSPGEVAAVLGRPCMDCRKECRTDRNARADEQSRARKAGRVKAVHLPGPARRVAPPPGPCTRPTSAAASALRHTVCVASCPAPRLRRAARACRPRAWPRFRAPAATMTKAQVSFTERDEVGDERCPPDV